MNNELYRNELLKYSNNQVIISISVVYPNTTLSQNYYYILETFIDYLNNKFTLINVYRNHAIFSSKYDANVTKNICIEIEEIHFLGRLIDLDVYFNNQQLSREIPRNCLICSNNSIICRREKTHNIDEIVSFIDDKVNLYKMQNKIKEVVNDAMNIELELEPSFGLVNLTSNGIHKDMNYNHFIKSMPIIIKYLDDIFDVGMSNYSIDIKLNMAKEIGLIAENDMYKSNGGINTYKGLIFILYSYVLGYCESLKNNCNIFDYIANLHRDILSNVDINSNGGKLYLNQNILGIRKEALSGFKIIEEVFKSNDYNYNLVYFISKIEDTVIIHKSNFKMLTKIQSLAKECLLTKDYDLLSKTLVNLNVSPGGSADLLIVSIVHQKLHLK